MKKAVIGFSVFLGLLLIFLLIGLLSISRILTPDFIVSQIEKSINVRADLKKVNINLFSVLSSIELEDLSLHNRDNFADNATLLLERTASTNPVIEVKKVDLKLNILALLKRNFQIKNFILIEPKATVILKENGNSLSYLFQKPRTIEGKPNPALNETKEVQGEVNLDKPFSIKTLPVSTNIGKIGMENAKIDIFIQKTLQKISLKNANFLLTDIDIQPDDLENHNSIKLTANMNISVLNSGGQETSFFKILSVGAIAPFVAKTGLVNPSINYYLTLKTGSYLNGLSVMDALSGALPALANLGIKMEGLSKKAELTKDVSIEVNYSSGKITFLNQVILPTPNYDLTLEKDSWIHLQTNEHFFVGGVLASKTESDKAIESIDLAIKAKLKTEDPTKIRNLVLGNLSQDNRINLGFTSSGNIKSPNVKLTIELPSLLDLGKEILGDRIKDEIKSKLPQGVEDTLNKGLKKLF